MTTKSSLLPSTPSQPTAWAFPLPGLLPEHLQVHLHAHTRIAMLLHLDQEAPAPVLHSCQLTPSAARIFLALLQAYPQYCPYQTLFTTLYPASQEASVCPYDQAWNLRPIRRALVTLAPALRNFGLEVVSLRGRGYVLAAAEYRPEMRSTGQYGQ